MPNTEESINETGMPEIQMSMDVYGLVEAPVDATLTIAGDAADAKATGDAIANVEAEISDIESGGIFPVGTIWMTISASAPPFSGTWQEITMPMSWNDLKNGTRTHMTGTGSGSVHFWLRTA